VGSWQEDAGGNLIKIKKSKRKQENKGKRGTSLVLICRCRRRCWRRYRSIGTNGGNNISINIDK